MNNPLHLIALTLLLTLLLSCGAEEPQELPILGERLIENGDTLYHTIPPFSYVNQDSQVVTNADFSNGIYIADFFFTSCPTICPKVKQQMLRIQAEFTQESRLKILSHSIDYRRDSVPVLKRYADKIAIDSERWHLVQLKKTEVQKVANEYFNLAVEDDGAPGGFNHSGRIMLIDSKGRIRSYAEGTEPESVDKLMADIRILLAEV